MSDQDYIAEHDEGDDLNEGRSLIDIDAERARLSSVVVEGEDDIDDEFGGFKPVEDEGEDDDAPEPDEPEYMSKAEFRAVFKSAFNFPAAIVPGLSGLAISQDDEDAADMASDAAHDLAKAYWPEVIRKRGGQMKNIIILGMFLQMKAGVVKAFLMERRAAKIAAAQEAEARFYGRGPVVQQEPANRPEPPSGAGRPAQSPVGWMDAGEGAA